MSSTPSTNSPDEGSAGRSRLPLIGVAVLVVVIAAVAGFLWFTRDTAPDELTISDDPAAAGEGDAGASDDVSTGSDPTDEDGAAGTGGGSGNGEGSPGTEIDPTDLDGTWTVTAGQGEEATVAGYRIDEVFAQGAREVTAYGRTTEVSGGITVADGQVTEGSFEVDMTTLASDESRRDNAIRSRGLQTDQFPTGTFALTEPAAIPELTQGRVATLAVTGELTLHGVTQPVNLDLNVKVSGDVVIIQGSAPVVLADFDMDPPNMAGFVTVSEEGTFEFIVNLTPT